MLILHIGLPKTGTTFLQKEVFRPLPDTFYIHRTQGSFSRFPKLQRLLSVVVREALVSEKDRFIYKAVRALLTSGLLGKVLVSDESISLGRMSFWEAQVRTPEQLAKSLERLQIQRRKKLRVKIVIGFRNPTNWIASRYAQSASGFPSPGQADFENRVADLFSSGSSSNGLSWLDRTRVVEAFSKSFGAQNVFDFSQEDLEATPVQVVTSLLDFMEFDSKFVQDFVKRPTLGAKRNSKSVGDGIWQLRGMDVTIRLSTGIVSSINSGLHGNSSD